MATWVIFKIALRNVFSHKLKTIIVGLILTFGALLAILGSAFVDAVAGGMQNSTTQSISGDIQIYSDEAKDKLSVFGNMDGSPSDVGHINHFLATANEIKTIPEVAEVVPMGTSAAFMNPGNILDTYLENLRKDYKNHASQKSLDAQKQRLRYIISEIKRTLDGKFNDISFLSASEAKVSQESLDKVSQPAFWADFDKNYEAKIEFLGNKIAPLIFDDNMIFFSYVGTHPQMFQKSFPQFEIVKGEMIPPGKRGFLFHDYFYENFVKHKIAKKLDQIKKSLADGHGRTTIANSKELQDKIQSNLEQAAEIFLQLGPVEAAELISPLQKITKSKESDFRKLLKEFLAMNDENFEERYDFFYKKIAPNIILYRVGVGGTFPINAYAKSGNSTSTNLKVYGTFRFKSFENSPLAGNFSIMDLVSFRELYGFVTEERRAQNKEIEAKMNIRDVDLNDENSIFGDKPKTKPKVVTAPVLDFKKKIMSSSYSESEILNGVFMHAAVILKDHSRMNSVIKKIQNLSKEKNLGLKAVSWQEAAGFIGQMTYVMKGVLYFFISIALLVAALMIVNSLLMAAMDRKQEIGTMRAIGAGGDFIYKLFFFETLFISLIFGLFGALLGSILVLVIGKIGIPASGDVATFFFSGPRLHLTLDPISIVTIVIILVIMAVIATQYPAWKAVKVSPMQAMMKKE